MNLLPYRTDNMPHGTRPTVRCDCASVTAQTWLILCLASIVFFGSSAYGLDRVSDDVLTDATALRASSVDDVVKQAPRVVASGTAEDKSLIRQTIEEVYIGDPARTAGLTFDQLQALQRFYRYLRADSRDRGRIVGLWLDQSAEATRLTPAQRVWLLSQFENAETAPSVAGTLKADVLRRLNSSSADAMTTRELASSVRALAPHLSDSEKTSLLPVLGQEWARRIAGKSPFNLTDSREASALRQWQEMFELLDDGASGDSQYIEQLPAYLAGMTAPELYWRFRYEYVELIAQPIRAEAAQDALLAKATGETTLRQDVLQVLSSSYRQTGRHKTWHQHLDRMIADEGLSDDQRAQWMIAKAYSLGLTDDTHRPTPLAGLPLMHQAMGLAETDDTRLACLRQIVLGYLGYFKFDAARSEVSRWREDFSQPGSEAIQQLETMITMTQHITDQVAAIEDTQ